MKREIPALTLAVLLFSLILSGTNPDTSRTQQSEPKEQHESVVTLKLVQVFVTDREGNPILDLAKSDFELFEDGVLKTITEFEKHLLSDETTEVSLTVAPTSPAKLNRKFFIFLDIFGNDRLGISKARKAALHFIDTQLGPDDEVAVITYQHMSGFNVKKYLTKDHEKIRKEVKKAREIPPGGDHYNRSLMVEQRRAEQEAGLEEDRWVFGSLYQPLFVAGLNRLARNSDDFTDEVTEVGRALRYIPGQKNIILFSGGRFGKAEKMGREFAASNSPVFSVNTVKPPETDSRARIAATNTKAAAEDKSSNIALETLSTVSGGKYFNDVEDVENISESIQSLTNNYYVLGYYVDEKWDGMFHRIEVKVEREECLVHCQEGYYNPRPFSEYTDTEKELHLIDLAAGDTPVLQTPLQLPLLPVNYPQQYKSLLVLLTELTSVELARFFSGKTDVVNVVFDDKGEVVDSTRGEVDLSGIGDKNLFHYSVHPLPPGRYKSRFVLRDAETGKGAVANASFDIPEWRDTQLRLYPPLLLIPDRNAEFIRYTRELKKRQPARLPSLDEMFPFVSNEHSPLIQGMDAGVSRILAVFRYAVQDIEAPDIILSADFVQKAIEDEKMLQPRILSAKEDKGTVVLLLEIQLSGIAPGDYTLRFKLEEESAGLEASISQDIKVR